MVFRPSGATVAGRYYAQGAGWLVLVLAILAVYYGIWEHQFVNFDDPMYLYENAHVTVGLTAESMSWAWTNKDAILWHPLTWLSHQLVSELAGMQPGPHLLVNLALHGLNAGLLFILLRVLTGAAGRSFAVALLFAVHPVNVETAVWASQLKSTLSTCFFLLGLLGYVRHSHRGGDGFSRTALGAMILSLLAKPMVVSFPLLLFLLDFWPLQRLPSFHGQAVLGGWSRWLLAKIPFVLVAGVVVVLVAWPWGAHPEMNTMHGFEWRRIAALPCNYARYLSLLVWPANLAVLYPEALDYSQWAKIGALFLLLGISAATWVLRWRHPALLVGWAWFLFTLLPVSGLVGIGPQGLADRYLYIPGIGLFIAVIWIGADAVPDRWTGLRPLLVGVVAVVCGGLAHGQVHYWRNSLALWQHAAAVTPPSSTLHVNLGNALLTEGRDREAAVEFRAAILMREKDFRPYVNLAIIAQHAGNTGEAINTMRQALALAPTDARILSNLGSLLQDAGQLPAARQFLERAVALQPNLPEAQTNLGVLLAQAGELSRALACFQAAARLKPDDPTMQQNLRLVLQQLATSKRARSSGQ